MLRSNHTSLTLRAYGNQTNHAHNQTIRLLTPADPAGGGWVGVHLLIHKTNTAKMAVLVSNHSRQCLPTGEISGPLGD
jgi:hypothetical protein